MSTSIDWVYWINHIINYLYKVLYCTDHFKDGRSKGHKLYSTIIATTHIIQQIQVVNHTRNNKKMKLMRKLIDEINGQANMIISIVTPHNQAALTMTS